MLTKKKKGWWDWLLEDNKHYTHFGTDGKDGQWEKTLFQLFLSKLFWQIKVLIRFPWFPQWLIVPVLVASWFLSLWARVQSVLRTSLNVKEQSKDKKNCKRENIINDVAAGKSSQRDILILDIDTPNYYVIWAFHVVYNLA